MAYHTQNHSQIAQDTYFGPLVASESLAAHCYHDSLLQRYTQRDELAQHLGHLVEQRAARSLETQPVTHYFLPLPPKDAFEFQDEMEIYVYFMRYLRLHTNFLAQKRQDIKISCAIEFAADQTGYSPDLVASLLVGMGLKAPRAAFPASFLFYCDDALSGTGAKALSATNHLRKLYRHWVRLGELD